MTSTDKNLPVVGRGFREPHKHMLLESKMGVFHYDTTNNRYICFADAEARDIYLDDTTQVELVLGVFDAPLFNFSAEINLTTPIYNAVFLVYLVIVIFLCHNLLIIFPNIFIGAPTCDNPTYYPIPKQ